MRVTSELWVKAYIRRLAAEGIFAVVGLRGAREAGAIYIKLARLDGTAMIFSPAPTGFTIAAEGRQWVSFFDPDFVEEAKADSYLQQQAEFDQDIWIVDVEDRDGRHFMEDWLAAV